MGNYYATGRSNYFAVNDYKLFESWAYSRGLKIFESDTNENMYMIAPGNFSDAGWPSLIYDEASKEQVELNIEKELSEHLKDGDVAILIEVGTEKLSYCVGSAIAVNSKGEIKSISLEDIYTLAESLGSTITRAED